MSDKAGSDLDVFDGLAAKKSRPSAAAPGPARVPSSSATRQKTLLGLAAPAPGAGPRPGAPPPPPAPSKPPSVRGTAPPPSKALGGGFPTPPPPPGPAGSSAGYPTPPPAPQPVSAPLAAPLPPLAPLPPAGALGTPPPPPPPTSASRPAPAPQTLAVAAADDETTPAPTAKGDAKASAEIDWDDEDEATMVFDKSLEDAARSLLHSAPPPPPAAGAPPHAPLPAASSPPAARAAALLSRPISAPPPSLPRAPLPPPPKTAPATFNIPAPPQAVFEAPTQPGSSRGLMIGIVVLLLAGAGAGAMFLMPKKGSIVLTVAGPGNKPVDTVEVYVDGAKKCEASPCRVMDLPAGTHLVKVTAAGYQPTADQAVKVTGGDEAVQNISLTRASDGTGFRVSAEGRGIKLSVDGKDVGPLPQELKDLTPGEHLVRLDGGDRYESFEKRITVEADQMQTIEPKLRVKKGLATIKLGDNADGAKVLLVSGSERRPLPQLPITVDISVDKPYSVVATKKGFGDFEEKVAFEDGQAERTFVVNLNATTAVAPAEAAAPATPAPAPAKPPSALAQAIAQTPVPPAAPKPVAATGNGTLNINAIPASNVVLDGRPMGLTPKTGLSVPAGPHTVIFVNADHGRKSKSITIEAGKSATVAVRFP